MVILDLIFIIILTGFILYGFWFGLLHAIGSLVGIGLGVFLAGKYHQSAADIVVRFFGNENLARIVSFYAIFIVVNRVMGLIFHFLGSTFGIITKLPFLKTINRLLGAILGVVEGILAIGIFVYIASRYHIVDWLDQALIDSTIAHYFLEITDILDPFIPEILKQLESIM